MVGHSIEMLCNAATLFSVLKAFVASISYTASVSSALNKLFMACTAASLPDF